MPVSGGWAGKGQASPVTVSGTGRLGQTKTRGKNMGAKNPAEKNTGQTKTRSNKKTVVV